MRLLPLVLETSASANSATRAHLSSHYFLIPDFCFNNTLGRDSGQFLLYYSLLTVSAMGTPEVIYQDRDFLVFNKPAGMLTHAIPNSQYPIPNGTVVDWLLKKYPEVRNIGDDPKNRPGIVHRLDRDTSGVLVVARNQSAFTYLKQLFQKQGIKKTYLALVYGVPKGESGIMNNESWGVIDKPLGLKSDTLRRTVHTKNARMVKKAVTRYRIKQVYGNPPSQYSLLEVEPLTGRTHQIRVHLAAIGHPVVGDKSYGPKRQLLLTPRQFLHAESLEFTAPDGSRLKVSADLPEDLAAVIAGFTN